MTTKIDNIPLPKEQMPPCWDEDVRMTALFAPFRLKSVNPTDYESKMKFWTEMISKWCQTRGSFSYDEVWTAFQRKGKYPACIEAVMEQMIKTGVLCPRSSIQCSTQGWISWGVGRMIKPASWAVSTLLNTVGKGSPPVDKNARYVHPESLKAQSLAFLSSIPMEAKIGNPKELWAASSRGVEQQPPGDTLELILTSLQNQNLATCSMDKNVYKLAADPSARVKALTEGEVCLPRLDRARRTLEGSIEKMEKKCKEERAAAKECLARGDRPMALGHLRQKKLMETRIEKALNSLDSITHLIESVKQAHSDSEIFDAFKTGLGALKTTMKTTGLEEDNVFDTMDEIKETLDVYNDIEEAISQPMGMTFDKAELEEELRELVLAEESAGGDDGNDVGGNRSKDADGDSRDKMFADLPDVPQSSLEVRRAGVADQRKSGKNIKNGENMEDFHKNMENRLKNLRLVSDT